MLKFDFFNRDASVVAQDLLGKVIHHRYKTVWLSAQIIETESYFKHEKGSHASLGFTEKRKALFMPPGTIYMYFARGKDSFNVSAKGEGNAVLVKSAIPYADSDNFYRMVSIMKELNPLSGRPRETMKLCSGQTLLCRSLDLTVKEWDQKSFNETLFIEDIGCQPSRVIKARRLGIPQGRDEHLMNRFIDYNFSQFATEDVLKKKRYTSGIDFKILDNK